MTIESVAELCGACNLSDDIFDDMPSPEDTWKITEDDWRLAVFGSIRSNWRLLDRRARAAVFLMAKQCMMYWPKSPSGELHREWRERKLQESGVSL